jgi:V8-like Glu-specific endopeptidase
MAIQKDGEQSDKNPPLRREELRRLQLDVAAIGEPPAELRAIEILPTVPPFQFAFVSRDSLRDVASEPKAPYRPQWVPVSSQPQRVFISGQPKKKLWHRGIEVDPLFIWDSDDRRMYNDTNYPWGCVCRIVTAAGTGSGVIVGPRHVLTASHVVDWNTNGAGTVEVHRAGPAVSAISAITRVWAFTKLSPPDIGWSEVDEDYAVLVTADRIGDRFGTFGVRTYDSGWDDDAFWWNIGYPRDAPVGNPGMFPIFQQDKALDEDEWDFGGGRAMTTTADTAKGQSGSPLFGFWDGKPYVVAVVSAQGTYFLSGDENWCSGGNDMTRLVNHAIANDP